MNIIPTPAALWQTLHNEALHIVTQVVEISIATHTNCQTPVAGHSSSACHLAPR